MVQHYIGETIYDSEEEIAIGVMFCLRKHHMVIERCGVVSVSTLLGEA